MTPKEPLSVTHPELANQADGWDPSTVSAGSHYKGQWKCLLGHSWVASVAHRANGTGCPVCSGNRVLTGFNDLATTDPELAKQANGWEPASVQRKSNLKKDWICELGHIWNVAPSQRTAGYGCPFCNGVKVMVGFNDLATTHPKIALKASGWNPEEFSKGSDSKQEWMCEYGHFYTAAISSQVAGRGCHFCSGHRVLEGFNDLATTEPELAKQAHGWDPTLVSSRSGLKKKWQCKQGHLWSAVVASRTSSHTAGRGCPVCAGKIILPGFNDLSTTDPVIAAQADGWDPRLVTRSTNLRKDWICQLGHKWRTSVNNRTVGNNCPACASSGFDANSDAWLYLVNHQDWELLQVGITNSPQTRLSKHKRIGWELIELRGPMDGLIARAWETSILQMLKRHGAKLASEEVAGKFDGYTEAWITESFKVSSLGELMDSVRRDEDRI